MPRTPLYSTSLFFKGLHLDVTRRLWAQRQTILTEEVVQSRSEYRLSQKATKDLMRLPSCSSTEVNSSKNIKGCNHPYRQPQPSLSEIEILYLESVRNTHAHNFFELDFRAIVDLHIIIVDKIGGYRSREELVDLHGQHSLPIDVDVAKVVRISREE